MVVRVHPHAWRWRAGAAAGALSVTLLLGYWWGASSDSEMPFFDSPEEANAMKKFGIKSPAELDDEGKKKFFNYVDKNFQAKTEAKK